MSILTNILKDLRVFPVLAIAGAALQGTVSEALANPAILAELQTAPHTAEAVKRLSAEWRTFEDDVTRVKKANLLTVWGRVAPLLIAGGVLQNDVSGVQHDPAITAELATCPALSAALADLNAEYQTLIAQFHEIRL